MAYDNKLKVDTEVFEKIRFIPVGDSLILKPIIPEFFEEEAMCYLINSNNVGVKKNIPEAYVENLEQAKKKLLDFSQRMIFRGSLFYCIRLIEQPFPIGYIHMNSPLTPTGLDSWTVDFWLGEEVQGNGIMTSSLVYLIDYLQSYGVPEIKALVYPDNVKSIKVLEKANFEFVHQEAGGERRYLYTIRLS